MRRQLSSDQWLNNFENESKCAALASSVVDLFSRVLEPYAIYTFPFLQYLLSSASIVLGLLIKEPSFRTLYSQSVFRAARMISIFLKKTWVSGRTVRSVARFNQLVCRSLSPDSTVVDLSSNQQCSRSMLPNQLNSTATGSSEEMACRSPSLPNPLPANQHSSLVTNSSGKSSWSSELGTMNSDRSSNSNSQALAAQSSSSTHVYAPSAYTHLPQTAQPTTVDFPFELSLGCGTAQAHLPALSALYQDNDMTHSASLNWLDHFRNFASF